MGENEIYDGGAYLRSLSDDAFQKLWDFVYCEVSADMTISYFCGAIKEIRRIPSNTILVVSKCGSSSKYNLSIEKNQEIDTVTVRGVKYVPHSLLFPKR